MNPRKQMNDVYDILLQLTNEELLQAWDMVDIVFRDDPVLFTLFRYQLVYTVQQLAAGRWKRGVRIHDQTYVPAGGLGHSGGPFGPDSVEA